MTRDVALRIDGMLMGVRGHLNSIAHYMKRNLPPAEYRELIKLIGSSMGETVEFSHRLHVLFPDDIPKELKDLLTSKNGMNNGRPRQVLVVHFASPSDKRSQRVRGVA